MQDDSVDHYWIVETIKGNLVKNYRREFDNKAYAEKTYQDLSKHGPVSIRHIIIASDYKAAYEAAQ